MKKNTNKKLFLGIFTHNFPEDKFDRKNAGIFVYDLVNELIKKVKVKVFFPSIKKDLKKVGEVECQTFTYSSKKNLGNLKFYNPLDVFSFIMYFIKGTLSLNKFINLNPDINFNIAMWAFPSGVFTYFLKKYKKIPYGIWSLGSDIYIYAKLPILSLIIKKILKEAEFLVADGIDLAKEVEKISKRKCIFIPSASKLTRKVIKGGSLSNGVINITYLGRMESVKGPDILLKALTKLKERINEYHIDVLGDGSMLNELKTLVKKEGISDQIIFFGNVSDQEKIQNILSKSDWLIIPSRSESIPLVFSEAMKCGLPIISSDLYDLKHLINKYEVGFTFKNDNVGELSKLLGNTKLLKDKRKLFSDNTNQVAKIFSIDYSSKQLIALIKKNVK